MKRITQVTVNNLFWVFNHTIPLNLEEHVTIMHGLNGYGKTTVLEMLQGLFNGGSHIFWSTPFERLVVTFDDHTLLSLDRVGDVRHPEARELRVQYGDKSFSLRRNPEVVQYARQQVEREIPELIPAGAERWQDIHTDEILYLEEVLRRYPDVLPPKLLRQIEADVPSWFQELRDSVRVHLIKTDRLASSNFRLDGKQIDATSIPGRKASALSVIGLHSRRIVQHIERERERYTERAQQSESTFPNRAIDLITLSREKEMSQAPSTAESPLGLLESSAILERLDQLKQKRQNLIKAGLLDSSDDLTLSGAIRDSTDDPTIRGFLSAYVYEMEYRLSVFDVLVAKIDLFKELVNNMLPFKRLEIDRRKGFVFHSAHGEEIPLSRLSSGEQHKVVLYYHLLFETPDQALILVDEPELSLHVVWQEEFVHDVKRIIDLVDVDVLIATHSPQVIRDRWDLTVRLKAPNREASA